METVKPKPELYKIYTFPEWLVEIKYWVKLEEYLIEHTVDVRLLDRYKEGEGWGCMIPQVIKIRATEMETRIGFLASALREAYKEKYNWIKPLAKQLYKQESAKMDRVNKYHESESLLLAKEELVEKTETLSMARRQISILTLYHEELAKAGGSL